MGASWIAHWAAYLAVEPEVGSFILHYIFQEKSQPVSPWTSCTAPKEENGKPCLSTLYLENPGRDHHKLELT